MKVRAPANTDHHRFLLPDYVQPYLNCFTNDLSQQGYTVLTIENYYGSIAHFSTWLHKQDIPLKDMSDYVPRYIITLMFPSVLCCLKFISPLVLRRRMTI